MNAKSWRKAEADVASARLGWSRKVANWGSVQQMGLKSLKQG
ncbi:hypothetical protein [Chroococcidiopsis sp. SAG 2025]|nr:hypothetical protein [Chroococcidiopsis sp. SAG 2025]